MKDIQQEQQKEAVPVENAVAEFIAMKEGENISKGTVKDHSRLLEGRLIPFCRLHGHLYIQQMDNPRPWAEFRQSWINLNPLHNKKPKNGVMPKPVPVLPGMARRLLGQIREFIRFCIGRDWLTKEWGSRQYLKITVRVEPKEPFTDEDVEAIFGAVKHVTDRGKTGQQNAQELLVFCYVLRYSGLRISDVTKLESSSLVPRPGDPENYSLHVFMKKTRKWVFIPIPSGDIPGEPDVAAALRSLPLKQGKYFFLGGQGTLRCNIASWQKRLGRLFQLVEKHGVKLSVRPHPHRFRHTFAARLLERGADVRDVAEWLGDTVAVVLKHYAKYTAKQQKIAVQRWKEAMLSGREGRKGKFRVIEGRGKAAAER